MNESAPPVTYASGIEFAAECPLVLPLDADSTRACVGGKGASLARLAQAGLPVPPGFHLTTAAYRLFVAKHNLQESILRTIRAASPNQPATCDIAAQTITQLFTQHSIPDEVEQAVLAAYRRLGAGKSAVAVRSSATAEDLPNLSFAGQQETLLNIRGEPELLGAIARCWASLWTARAISYRLRNQIAAESVSLAVVVQELISADAAGILFTANPLSGDQRQVLINASWGLGEAIVGGLVTPDTIVIDKHSGAIVSSHINTKSVMTVQTPNGTHEAPVPPELREAAVLHATQAAELAQLGVQIEALYAQPMDVEWTLAQGRFAIVQARPITALQRRHHHRDAWNDSATLDCLWTRGNIGEAIPDVVTPCSLSLLNIVFDDMMPTLFIGGHSPVGIIGGRLYFNLSMLMTILASLGMSRQRMFEATGELFGRVPDDVAIPVLPMSRWTVLRTVVGATIRNRRRIRSNIPRLPAFVAAAPARSETLLARIQAASTRTELVAIWHNELLPFLHECNYMLEAGSKSDGGAFIRIRSTLRKLVGDADANTLLTAGKTNELASLGLLQGLDQLMRGDIDRVTFVRLYGHHSPHLFEISYPRPAEDPQWLEEQLTGLRGAPIDLKTLLARQQAAQAAAWERFTRHFPRQSAKLKPRIARARQSAQEREAARSAQARVFWPIRAFVLRAGDLTGHGETLFFLTIHEILALLAGDESMLTSVAERQEVYADYTALPPYPALIRGHFDPFAWAADPQRRNDLFDENRERVPQSNMVSGFPASPGIAEGRARVVLTVEEGEQLQPGEVLVTTVTNVGWTPLFPRAAAVVTDVGAPLSHAAIVARELGIPAVVGCGNATMHLRNGDLVRVNGNQGTVEVHRAT